MQRWALPVRVRHATLMAAVAVAWLGPAPAPAGWGDYVMVHGEHRVPPETHAPAPTSVPHPPSPSLPEPPAAPRPICNGPQCSSSPLPVTDVKPPSVR